MDNLTEAIALALIVAGGVSGGLAVDRYLNKVEPVVVKEWTVCVTTLSGQLCRQLDKAGVDQFIKDVQQ